MRIQWIPGFWLGLIGCKSLPVAPVSSQQFMLPSSQPKSMLLTANLETDRLYSGVARVQSDLSCTGALVATNPAPESPAYLVTAGHCVMNFGEEASAFTIYQNAFPKSDPNQIHFRYFAGRNITENGSESNDDSPMIFRIGRVDYASMKGLDLALVEITQEESAPGIYELTPPAQLSAEVSDSEFPKLVTVGDLQRLGIEPLALASKIPAFGEAIHIISAPQGGEQPEAEGFLREHRCRHEGLASVVESLWYWFDLARNDCLDILPGSSGAPIFNAQNELFAIVNTSSRDALSDDCYFGQPCEITEQGFQVAQNRNYATVITWLHSCFDDSGRLNPTLPHCALDPGSSPMPRNVPKTPLNPARQSPALKTWNVSLGQENQKAVVYRYKVGSAMKNNCRDGAHYSQPLAGSDHNLQNLPLPTAAGLYTLCLLSEEAYQIHNFAFPAVVVLNIDQRPPILPAKLISDPLNGQAFMAIRKSCEDLPNQANFEQRKKCAAAVLTFEAQVPELTDFHFGWTSPTQSDCSNLIAENEGFHVSIPVSSLPARLCAWGIDGAGNRAVDPTIHVIRAATRREIMDATDIKVD